MKITKNLSNGETLILETEKENGKTFYRARYSNDPGNAGFEDDRGEIGENETAEEIADRLAGWLQENINEDQNRISSSFAFDQAKEMSAPYAKESGEPLTEYLMRDYDANPSGWNNCFEFAYDEISSRAKEERRNIVERMIAGF